jgi:hypothetical protein
VLDFYDSREFPSIKKKVLKDKMAYQSSSSSTSRILKGTSGHTNPSDHCHYNP